MNFTGGLSGESQSFKKKMRDAREFDMSEKRDLGGINEMDERMEEMKEEVASLQEENEELKAALEESKELAKDLEADKRFLELENRNLRLENETLRRNNEINKDVAEKLKLFEDPAEESLDAK
jgi:predicted nuclease with TOPRIM domain